MQNISTHEHTAMVAASLTSSDSVEHDGQTQDILADVDDYDGELSPVGFQRLRVGFRRLMTGLKEGLGNMLSPRHYQGSVDDLREALAEGRSQVEAERRADRRAMRKARAQLDREAREIRIAHQRGLLAQQADFIADSMGA